MLRWRGITTELTDELLANFLSSNTFEEVLNKDIIFNQNYFVLLNVNYNLHIEYGDITLGKGISTNFEEGFFLKLSNRDIYSILTTLSEWFELGNDWKFEGKLPETEILNVTVKSDATFTNEENKQTFIEDIILKLANELNFIITSSEEIQEIWYITPNTTQLKEYLSIDQSLNLNVVDQTESYTKYKNVFFDFLASSLSIRTKAKVEYNSSEPPLFYDLTIPKANDIIEIKSYLRKEYGIDLVKKKIKAKVKTVTFN